MKLNDGRWPTRRNIFGVEVSVTDYDQVISLVIDHAKKRTGGAASFLPVHGIVLGATNRSFREAVNELNIIGPDGQPVRWALNLLHDANLTERVYGPELMLRVCREAAKEGIGIYLYGSTIPVLVNLRSRLESMMPDLKVVGIESPPFRPLTDVEKDQAAHRLITSGAGIVFVGLGCPRQELFAADMKKKVGAVLLCVGAAFDFHAGTKPMAPARMQRLGLEWLFRLYSEPGRLWKRYLLTNTAFIAMLGYHLFRKMVRNMLRGKPKAAPAPQEAGKLPLPVPRN